MPSQILDRKHMTEVDNLVKSIKKNTRSNHRQGKIGSLKSKFISPNQLTAHVYLPSQEHELPKESTSPSFVS